MRWFFCRDAGCSWGDLVAVIVAVSGWRGFKDCVVEHRWIPLQLGFWAAALTGGGIPYWRVGDEPEGFDLNAKGLFDTYPQDYCQYFANWNLPHGAGGPVRSDAMLQGKSQHDQFQGRKADYLLAFPQPGKRLPKHEEVSGTWRAVELAKKHGITVIIPGYQGSGPESLF